MQIVFCKNSMYCCQTPGTSNEKTTASIPALKKCVGWNSLSLSEQLEFCYARSNQAGNRCSWVTDAAACSEVNSLCTVQAAPSSEQLRFYQAQIKQSESRFTWTIIGNCRDYHCEDTVSPQSQVDCDATGTSCMYLQQHQIYCIEKHHVLLRTTTLIIQNTYFQEINALFTIASRLEQLIVQNKRILLDYYVLDLSTACKTATYEDVTRATSKVDCQKYVVDVKMLRCIIKLHLHY